MRTAVFLLTSMLMVTLTQAVVCPKDYCKRIECPEGLTQETCKGHLVPNSSFCGCCPTCVTYIKPLGFCINISIKAAADAKNFMRRKCMPGFICSHNRCYPLD